MKNQINLSLAIDSRTTNTKFWHRTGEARGNCNKAKRYALSDIAKETVRGELYISRESEVINLCAMPERIVALALVENIVVKFDAANRRIDL
jgi:hypothetical protein